MDDTILQLLDRYRTKGVLVDTNILLLLFVGSFNTELIPRFKRTKIFTPEEYSLLSRFLGKFKVTATIPNILSEVSNLSAQLPASPQDRDRYFREFAERIRVLDERYVPSKDAVAVNSFSRIGLTDAAILHLAKGQFLVLTDDHRLAGTLEHAGVDAINFNHIRFLA